MQGMRKRNYFLARGLLQWGLRHDGLWTMETYVTFVWGAEEKFTFTNTEPEFTLRISLPVGPVKSLDRGHINVACGHWWSEWAIDSANTFIEILGFHSGDYEECRLLGCGAGSPLADFSTLKLEAIRSSETSVNARSTQPHIPEDDILLHISLFTKYLLTSCS
jgi:hypothetical protein